MKPFRILKAGLIGCAALCTASPALADTLIDNIQGISVDREGEVTRFNAMVIDDDGSISHILDRKDDRPDGLDFRIDGKGRVVLPGMIDAHGHVMGVGIGALTLDLADTNSLEEAQAKIAKFAAENPARPWILGRGWNQEKWGLGRFPTAAEIDEVVADRPVWLERIDGHASWGNTAALKAAKITSASKSPEGGKIERLPGSRKPSGVFVDAAADLVNKVVPAPRPQDRDVALSEAQKILFARGVTAMADMGTSIEDWQTFRRAGDTGRLQLRIMAYANSIENMQLIAGARPTPWLYEDRLRLNGIKLYLDGALGSRGAWLKEHYRDAPGEKGLILTSGTKLRNQVSLASLSKFQVAMHAIGDAANSEALSVVEEMSDTYTGDRRWRIEHAQIVDPADLPRFAQNGIIASMQPVHQTSDRTMAEARMGLDRLGGAYAWRSLTDAGVPLAFGSDAPVERPDPFTGLAVAISRTDENGEPFGGWLPQEAVTREQALAAYTSGASYAGFGEGRFGELAVGQRADFIIVDRDPLLSSASEIRETQVMETWIGGRKVYEKPERAPIFEADEVLEEG